MSTLIAGATSLFKDWFSSTVAAAVIIILAAAGGNAMMGLGFDALSLAGAVSMLLMLPILHKLAGRRPRHQVTPEVDVESTHIHPVRKRKP